MFSPNINVYPFFLVLQTEPFHKFSIPIATEEFNEEDDENGFKCSLVFTFTEKYPDSAPIVEIEDALNFEDYYETSLLEDIESTISENLGMEMIFSLVSAAQEWLNVKWDEHKNALEEQRVRRLREAEEVERKKFEGTRVTVETFMKWKMEFEEQTGVTARREKNKADSNKLTGKELFMQDNTLNDSDIKFLMEAGDSIENVKIDESLFQNIGDLDLDEDEEDDEDYVPGKDD